MAPGAVMECKVQKQVLVLSLIIIFILCYFILLLHYIGNLYF